MNLSPLMKFRFTLGESPIYIPSNPNLIVFPDIDERRVYRFNRENGSLASVQTEGRVGFIQPTSNSRIVLAGMEHTIGLLNIDNGKFTTHNRLPLPDGVRLNEGRLADNGMLVTGANDTACTASGGRGSLWTLMPGDCEPECVLENVGIPNGTGFYNGNCYWLNSRPPDAKIFRVGEQTLEDPQPFPAILAGFVRDKEGVDNNYGDGMFRAYRNGVPYLLVALQGLGKGGGKVRAFNLATNTYEDEWNLPQSSSATCPLVTPDGILFVTSQGGGRMDKPGEDNAGKVFWGQTDFRPGYQPVWLVK